MFWQISRQIFRVIFLESFGGFVVLIFFAFLSRSSTFSLNIKYVQYQAGKNFAFLNLFTYFSFLLYLRNYAGFFFLLNFNFVFFTICSMNA